MTVSRTSWSNCSVPCGGGVQFSQRTCPCSTSSVDPSTTQNSVPHPCSQPGCSLCPNTIPPCSGPAWISQTCNLQLCPVARTISQWQNTPNWPSGCESKTISQCSPVTWRQIINEDNPSSDWGKLAQCFAAALLNVHIGCSPSSQVSAALAATQTLLQTCTFTPDQQGTCNAYGIILNSFNRGKDSPVLNDLGNDQNYFTGGESADSNSDVSAPPPRQNVSYLVYVIPSVVGVVVIALIVALYVVRRKKNEKTVIVA